jgi:hypothetical protein
MFSVVTKHLLEASAKLCLDKAKLDDPLISPAYRDLRRFPPTISISGTRDLFLQQYGKAMKRAA